MDGSFLSNVRAAWSEQERALALSSIQPITTVRRAPNESKLVIDVRAGEDVAQISAWTSGNCVDVVWLRSGATEPSVLFSGGVGNLEELANVLAKLRALLIHS